MTQIRELKDISGRITVGVFQEQIASPASKTELSVAVDEDMVAVGGGGIGSSEPGGYLTASFPDESLRNWTVASTDHTAEDPHRLVAFALGLKIDGMTREQLMLRITVVRKRGGRANHPRARAALDADMTAESRGQILISGGFHVMPNDGANLATASHPEFQRSWSAASKDHFTPFPASIESYAIGIQEVLPVGRVILGVASEQGGFSSRPSRRVTLDGSFALTGLGALLHWTEPGCLLWKLAPLLDDRDAGEVQGVDAAGKDHLSPSEASIQVWAMGIRLNEDPCK